MIWRIGATFGAVVPVAGAIARDKAALAASSVPVIWHFVGYPFEAGPMIAGLCACLAVRLYVASVGGEHRWSIDLPVSAIALMFTAGIIIRLRPEPFWALVYGTGLGAAGALIIRACLAWIKKGSDLFEPPKGA